MSWLAEDEAAGRTLWRFALAAVIVIVFTAATTAVAGLMQFKQLAADISHTPALKQARVTMPTPGSRRRSSSSAPTIARAAVEVRQHRHHDAGPARPELLDDQRAVGAPRPGGPDPGEPVASRAKSTPPTRSAALTC